MVPYRCRAASAHNIDQFFEQVSLRFQGLSWRDLADVSVIGLASACKTNPTSQPPGSRPWLERNFPNVFKTKSLDKRNPFACQPIPVGTSVLSDRSWRNLGFFHCFSRHRALNHAIGFSRAIKSRVDLFDH